MSTATLDERLTNSQITCAATCLRKHKIAYLHGIRPAGDATPLRWGKLWHNGLDRRAKGMQILDNLKMVRNEYDMLMNGISAERDIALAYECETVCTLLNLYNWRWEEADSKKMVIASEESFEVPIVNPDTGRSSRTFVFAGKTDRRVRLEDGRHAIEENKSTSDDIAPDSSYWKRLRIDTQIARYVLAARAQGHAIDTVLYDVVKKPGTRPGSVALLDPDGVKIVNDATGQRVRTKDGKKWRESADKEQGYVLQTRPETPREWGNRLHADVSQNPDKYFARREIPRTDMDITEARAELWDHSKILQQCENENRWPRNSNACIGFGTCPYLDLCSTNYNPDDSDVVPDGFIRVTDAHQELLS